MFSRLAQQQRFRQLDPMMPTRAVAVAVASVLAGSSSCLKVGSAMLEDRHLVGLAPSLDGRVLTELDFNNNKLGPAGVRHIVALLEMHPEVSKLDLRGNCIGEQGVQVLAEALKGNTTLTSLDLRRNRIDGRAGASHLAAMLEEDVSLESLDLRHNRLGQEGVNLLAAAIENSGGTPDLNVVDCCRSDAHALTRLNSALEINRTKTKVLTLNCSPVEHGGLRIACTNLAGEEVANERVMLIDTLTSIRSRIAQQIGFPAQCIKLVLPDGTLLDDPTHSIALGEVLQLKEVPS